MSKSYEFCTSIPVDDKAQVVVVGGGTAGAVAAIAAAREGMDTLVIEPFGSLGGSAVNSLVTPLMTVGIPENPMNSSISDEINRRTSAGSLFSRWNAIRWALFGPTPGNRPSSSMRSWTTPSYTDPSLRAPTDNLARPARPDRRGPGHVTA